MEDYCTGLAVLLTRAQVPCIPALHHPAATLTVSLGNMSFSARCSQYCADLVLGSCFIASHPTLYTCIACAFGSLLCLSSNAPVKHNVSMSHRVVLLMFMILCTTTQLAMLTRQGLHRYHANAGASACACVAFVATWSMRTKERLGVVS